MSAQDKSSLVIRETANEWAARLSAVDLSHTDKVAFAAWLRASPIHVREYLNAEALRVAVADAVHDDNTDIRELLQDEPSNVVALNTDVSRSPATASRPFSSALRILAIAASILIVVSFAATYLWAGWLGADAYSTGIGEIRQLALLDGSTVELNTASNIRVDFDDGRRDIHLVHGEAFFTVAKDARRPFRVLSDSAVVRAIGTQFSVYRKPSGTVVTVLEGKVAAHDKDEVVELTAGQQATIESGPSKQTALAKATAVDAKRATAWRQHRLIFDNQPLSEVIAEFNRYNRQQLVIEDPTLAAQGISGVFDPEKPQGLLIFLDRKGGVTATEREANTLVLTPRNENSTP